MRRSHREAMRMNPLGPGLPEVSQNAREVRRIRILLLSLLVVEVTSVSLPRLTAPWWCEINFVPQLLIGFVVLVLIFTLHLASQSKLLGEVSTALNRANSYVNELEQLVLIDAPTQLFNRRFLDHLFNQQSKWLNRSGESAALLL